MIRYSDPQQRAQADAALFKLARLGYVQELSRLLDRVDPKALRQGRNLLHEAAANARVECVELLAPLFDLEAKTSAGLTAMHHAALSGDPRAIQAIRAAGGQIDSKAADGATPLHAAAGSNLHASVGCLIRSGADPDARDDLGRTPLMGAARTGSPEAANILMDHADLLALDHKGRSAMDHALESPSLENGRVEVARSIRARIQSKLERQALADELQLGPAKSSRARAL